MLSYCRQRQSEYLSEAINVDFRSQQSALTLSIAENWLEKPVKEHLFLSYWTPDSPGHRKIVDRNPYIRLPSGATVPVWLQALASGERPTLKHVFRANGFCYLCSTILVGIIAQLLLLKCGAGRLVASLLATFGAVSFACSGAVGGHFSLDYFHTEAVIPFFLFAILLESASRNLQPSILKKMLEIALVLTVLIGCLTDWFMFLVAFCMWLGSTLMWFVTRRSELTKTIGIPIAVFLAAGLLALQVHRVDGWAVLAAKFLQRTGIASSSGTEQYSVIKGFFHRALGLAETQMILVATVVSISALVLALCISRNIRRGRSIPFGMPDGLLDCSLTACLLLLPCWMHCLLLREHYSIHSDNSIKFLCCLCIFYFGPLCGMIIECLRMAGIVVQVRTPRESLELASTDGRLKTLVLIGGTAIAAACWTVPSFAGWRGQFEPIRQLCRDFDATWAHELAPYSDRNTLIVSDEIRVDDSYEWLRISGIIKNQVYHIQSDATHIGTLISDASRVIFVSRHSGLQNSETSIYCDEKRLLHASKAIEIYEVEIEEFSKVITELSGRRRPESGQSND